jgi:hypothetical protein
MDDTVAKILEETLTHEQMKLFEMLGPPALIEGRGWRVLLSLFGGDRGVRAAERCEDWIYVRDLVDLEWDLLRDRTAKAHLISDAGRGADLGLDPMTDYPQDGSHMVARAIGSLMPTLQ